MTETEMTGSEIPGTDVAGTAATGRVWTDSHCHIHDERIPDGPDGAVAAAAEMGVSTLVTVGCDRATSLAAIDVAGRHAGVFATIGLHPHDAVNGVDSIADLITPERIERSKIVAIGEAGLDYYYEHSPRDVQRQAFESQIALAHEHDLPFVIHTRDAWADTFDVLDALGTPDRTVFHCFTGGPDEAKQCLDRGAFLSFSGIVTFNSAPEVQEAARQCPLDRLLVETDSPYLAPIPHRGKKNRPAWVPHVGQFIADLRDVPVDAIAAATVDNTVQAFPGLAVPRGAG